VGLRVIRHIEGNAIPFERHSVKGSVTP